MQSGNKDPQKCLYLCQVSSFYVQATHMPAQTCPQSLTAECSLPSFCVRLRKRIPSSVSAFLRLSEHRQVHRGHCRGSTKCCRKLQFRLLLTVDCVLQLAPASSHCSHYRLQASPTEVCALLRAVPSLKGSVRI